MRHTVSAAQEGRLLRDLLRRELNISAKLLARIKRIPNGILCNHQPVFVNMRVHAGDELQIVLEQENGGERKLIPTPGELLICYEDADILVVDKPAGLPVHPGIGNRTHSLGNIVIWHYAQRGEPFVYRPVNRLDSGTSGIMVIAKNSYSHTALTQQLHTGDFTREYLAIVHGAVEADTGTIWGPIQRREGSVLAREVHPEGARACTHFHVIERLDRWSLIRLRLETGRTHQIRVHMAWIGHPLAGDFLYGVEEPEYIARCALHSAALELKLPLTHERLHLEASAPEDMEKLWNLCSRQSYG